CVDRLQRISSLNWRLPSRIGERNQKASKMFFMMKPKTCRFLLGWTAAASALFVMAIGTRCVAAGIGDVFVIAFENHNFTQPDFNGTPQLLGNSAAPFLNSLITSGNSNAAQTSYATSYYNVGMGVHPSQANYTWAEAGSSLGDTIGSNFAAPH